MQKSFSTYLEEFYSSLIVNLPCIEFLLLAKDQKHHSVCVNKQMHLTKIFQDFENGQDLTVKLESKAKQKLRTLDLHTYMVKHIKPNEF